MYKIVIGIPTYKRPGMLKKLVISIIKGNIDRALIKDINILVVDNDIERTAEKVVEEISTGLSGILKLNYCNYPVKGLSNVRNELYKKALEFNPDFIVSLDDDEYPSPDWLNQLLLTVIANKGDIAVGPVFPEFENKVSPYISYWFRYHDLPDQQRTKVFETSNYIISTDFLLKHKLEFDNRFNSTGAEDSYFRVTILKKGAKIYWAREAKAFEAITEKRAKLKWLFMRNFRCAITYTYILKLEGKYSSLLKKSLISIVYFIAGLLALSAILFPVKWKYWGIIKISESLGGFAGLFNFKYHEYAKAR